MGLSVEKMRDKIRKCDMGKPFAFVSYSKKDAEKVYALVLKLQEDGYNIWIDKELIELVGRDWQIGALKAIANPNCKVLLYCMSENSLISAPVCAELCWSKSEKVKDNNDGEEMKIVPILMSDEWKMAKDKDFMNWIANIASKNGNNLLTNTDIEVLENIVDKKYTSNPLEKLENHGEIATLIKKEIFVPLGGSKVTCAEVGDIVTIEVNMKNTKVEEDIVLITNDEIEEEEETNIVTDDTEEPSDLDGKKKSASITGDITYTLYGKEYTDNQANMMLRIFAQVLKRHPDKVATLPEQAGMNCAMKYEDIKNPGESSANPSYFRSCEKFTFENGASVCIGTAYSSGDKMKKIARLLDICEEDRSVFCSEQIALPQVKASKVTEASKVVSNGINYSVYGEALCGDQTDMMTTICSKIIEKHPDKLQAVVDGTLCVGYKEGSTMEKSYFRVYREFTCNGVNYVVGTSFGMPAKIKEIEKVIHICGEDVNNIKIDGVQLNATAPTRKGRTKVKENFLED